MKTGTPAATGDPLASLAPPSPAGVPNYGSVNLTGGSQTIKPGIYSQIKVSGSGSLTLTAGVYIIEGGGFTVSGNASVSMTGTDSVSGTGVMIYNCGSNYPTSGGNFGGITLSGNGSINLTAPTAGPYEGVLFFQSRENTRALSLSGSGMLGLSGTIYAASAAMVQSGNAQLNNVPLVVGTLNLTGNAGAAAEMAAGAAAANDIPGGLATLAGTLLGGELDVYVDNSTGGFSADELARVQDAIDGLDALLAPYSVVITEVNDPASANLVLNTGTASAVGSTSAGVLGCYDPATSTITILQGWNWYAGADPSQIAANQYDFQTAVTHELGHALGLGHSTAPGSTMNGTLPTDATRRAMSVQDLNIPDPPDGADPLTAAGFGSEGSSATRVSMPAAAPTSTYDTALTSPGRPAPTGHSVSVVSVLPSDHSTVSAVNGSPVVVVPVADSVADSPWTVLIGSVLSHRSPQALRPSMTRGSRPAQVMNRPAVDHALLVPAGRTAAHPSGSHLFDLALEHVSAAGQTTGRAVRK